MPFFTRPELIDEQFKQLAGTDLNLSGTTNFFGTLKSKGIEIDASTGGTFAGYVLTFDGSKIKLLPSTSGGTGVYPDDDFSTIEVGGIPVNYSMLNKSFPELWKKLLVVYLAPTFSTFNNNSILTLNEVGNPVNWSGNNTFSWNTTNSGNVQPNSIEIIDVTNGNAVLGTGLANDGTEILPLGITINNNIPISHTWGVKGTNTETNPIAQKNYTITSIYPWFSGTYASGGAPSGGNRPDPNNPATAQGLIDSSIAVVTSSNGTISVANFGATPDDYIWFAIPSTSASKFVWYVNALDNGAIGGGITPAGNLFPAPVIINVNSPSAYWNVIQYKIYLSNKQVNSTYMEFRNS
jgi:hypothetical protein